MGFARFFLVDISLKAGCTASRTAGGAILDKTARDTEL
jgi:hypothetical protein